MFKKSPRILLPYLVIALIVLIIQPIVSWYKDVTEEKMTTIHYMPPGSIRPAVYQVKTESIKRVGSCITFSPEQGGEESLTLCERYEELTTH